MAENPVTLLYHARTNGAVCRQIAEASNGRIVAVCDRDGRSRFDGTLVRWDSKLDATATKTINSADAVRLSRNKRKSRIALSGLCPPTWFKTRDIEYPCVIRPSRHYGGKNFWVCKTSAEALARVKKCLAKKWYASKLIDKQTEFRVFVLNEKAFKIIRRYRDDGQNDVAWNFHNGGKNKRVKEENWPKSVVSIATAAAERLGLDFCAVDVIVDKKGNPYVLEANTAPGLSRGKTFKKFAEVLVKA